MSEITDLQTFTKSELYQCNEQDVVSMLKEHSRTLEDIAQDVEILKKWLKTQTHLPKLPSDKYLANFYVLNKCSIEKTKIKLDLYFTVKCRIPEFFGYHPLSPLMLDHSKTFFYVPIPKLTENLHRVSVFKLDEKHSENVDLQLVISYILNVAEIRLFEDTSAADIQVFDMTGITMKFFKSMTPVLLLKLKSVVEAFSARYNALHVINMHPMAEKVYSYLPVKNKLRTRLHVHKDYDSLYKAVPKAMLPKDFGGEQKSLEELRIALQEKFEEYKEHFDWLLNLEIDENLRPDKPIDDDFLGFHGNFKQLSVD